ncbi:MAG: ABC transporter permease [Bryobacteraceae bacterium]|jgi:ABC-type multidrug transport system permease subunit
MKPYIAYIRTTLRLTGRERIVIFFNYLFPLAFLIGLGEIMGPVPVFALVLTLNILGTGFFGAGMRATMDREAGILRRFKVAPITPGPILVASMVTGWVVFVPALIGFIAILNLRYHMPLPPNIFSLFVFLSLGVVAFRSMGMIVASVVNSMQESQIIVQLLYMPMLLLSGATIPLTIMPDWLQTVAQFLPSNYLNLGMQGILLRRESLAQNWQAVAALLATALLCFFVSLKLFRWEKEDRLKPSAKLWVLAALLPFVIAGAWQVYDRGNLRKVQILAHQARRNVSWLVRDARIFTGDRVIERGSLLIRNGVVERIYEGDSPSASDLNAEGIAAAGKTALPGLIDAEVVLAMNAGLKPGSMKDVSAAAENALAAYLYSGVTGIGSIGLPPQIEKLVESRFVSGEKLGAMVLRSAVAPAQGPCRMTELSFSQASAEREAGDLSLLKETLVEEVAPRALLTRLESSYRDLEPHAAGAPSLETAERSLMAARAHGTKLAAATLSGTALLVHGPMLHHELRLLVQAGLTPLEALRAATSDAADCLGAPRAGRLGPGADASFVLVEGNPLEEISSTERIVEVFLHGENVHRGALVEKK